MVVSELRGEKIDIIPFNEEPARFVAKALSPARVREVLVDDEAKQATVIVPDDQLSLAIGKDGLNARLAARLTGWRVDIRSETEFAEEESEMGYAEEDVSGRCAAILANGKRCPNASLPGSRYCGLPAHQALEGTGTDYLVPPEDEGEGDDGDLRRYEDLTEEEAPHPRTAICGRGPRRRRPRRTSRLAGASADQPTDEEPVETATRCPRTSRPTPRPRCRRRPTSRTSRPEPRTKSRRTWSSLRQLRALASQERAPAPRSR